MGKRVTEKERAFVQPLGLEQVDWRPAPPSLRWVASDWQPALPPELRPGEKVGLDFEYVPNERDVTKSRPIAYSVYSPERKQGWYIPWGHAGGNLPKEDAIRWFGNELRDRDVYGLNTKAEVHMALNLGLDPERMGMRPHDIAFSAALLNEERVSGFSLEALAEEYLTDDRKVHPGEVPPQYFSLAHAGFVQERGISDSRLAMKIHEATYGAILAEALDKVNNLEDEGIYAVVEMERNGAIIDRPKLERWIAQVENRVESMSKILGDKAGIKHFNANKADDMFSLWQSTGRVQRPQVFDEKKKSWSDSWGAEAIEPYAFVGGKLDKGVADPTLAMALELKGYKSILEKYLYKYLTAIDSNNVLRYGLHQMRSVSDGNDSARGTVTGRFSCGGGKYAVNIQQVMKAEQQLESLMKDFIIRELFLPAQGKVMGASDASQIEFRLFSHAAAKIGYMATAEAYALNPMVDFHMLVTILMNPTITDKAKLKALRKEMKHNNFGVLYGMGREKLARRLGLPCTCPVNWAETRFDERSGRERLIQYFKDNREHDYNCLARQANDIMDEYAQKFPEAKKCADRAQRFAKEHGYISTLMGRRRHFPHEYGLHKAFNSWDQGSAADYFKIKMIEFHRAQLVTMRMPVHDEFVYDVEPDPVIQGRGVELLNSQSLELMVPLLWETGYGANWREANGQ